MKTEMKRENYQCIFYNNTDYIKCYDNNSIMLLGSHLEKITSITTVQRGLKGSSSKISINFPRLKDPAQYLHYICQISWRQDDDALYTPKWEKRTEHFSRLH